jgi:uncharacterized pyridoxamine 5'-phosphate oxidase family protein
MVDEVAAFISATSLVYVATVDAENKPRVRPFGGAFSINGHLWLGTNSQKKVWAELQNNPSIEVCSYNPKDGNWVRVSGKAVLADEFSVKQKLFEITPLVAQIYQTPENPIFRVFYIEGQADFYSLGAPNSGPGRSVTLA